MVDSFFGMVSAIGVVALVAVIARLYSRIGLLEREIGALRSFVLSLPDAGKAVPPSSEQATPGMTTEATLLDEPGPAALRASAAVIPLAAVAGDGKPAEPPDIAAEAADAVAAPAALVDEP